MEVAPPPHHGQGIEKEVKELFESSKERVKQCEGKGWHSKMSVNMKDWFGGRNDMLHYLRTGELQGQLQHRPGEMGREGQGDDCAGHKENTSGAGIHGPNVKEVSTSRYKDASSKDEGGEARSLRQKC